VRREECIGSSRGDRQRVEAQQDAIQTASRRYRGAESYAAARLSTPPNSYRTLAVVWELGCQYLCSLAVVVDHRGRQIRRMSKAWIALGGSLLALCVCTVGAGVATGVSCAQVWSALCPHCSFQDWLPCDVWILALGALVALGSLVLGLLTLLHIRSRPPPLLFPLCGAAALLSLGHAFASMWLAAALVVCATAGALVSYMIAIRK
jgi:hypothetical protein